MYDKFMSGRWKRRLNLFMPLSPLASKGSVAKKRPMYRLEACARSNTGSIRGYCNSWIFLTGLQISKCYQGIPAQYAKICEEC